MSFSCSGFSSFDSDTAPSLNYSWTNSFKSFMTLALILIASLYSYVVHFIWPCFPHSIHVINFIFFSVRATHSFRHLYSSWPIELHFLHCMTFFSVHSLAWWPILLHLKHIFSVQSNESWVSFPHRIQFCFFVSFGHSLAKWPNYLQLWHLIVGFSSAQYLEDLHFFIIMSNFVYSSSD